MKNPWKREMISKTARQLIIQTTITFYYFFNAFPYLFNALEVRGFIFPKFCLPIFYGDPKYVIFSKSVARCPGPIQKVNKTLKNGQK